MRLGRLSHRIKLGNMDISPDSDYNSIPQSERRVGQDGIQILNLNDLCTSEIRLLGTSPSITASDFVISL
ncbi:hypothetical protein GRJ2_000947400 [Grus japonensis]|uniref:Uncharacterized protein n=1 Tax=Grus japonensis TaxID=30415 RepID=A0ABC9WHV3_GRUJA